MPYVLIAADTGNVRSEGSVLRRASRDRRIGAIEPAGMDSRAAGPEPRRLAESAKIDRALLAGPLAPVFLGRRCANCRHRATVPLDEIEGGIETLVGLLGLSALGDSAIISGELNRRIGRIVSAMLTAARTAYRPPSRRRRGSSRCREAQDPRAPRAKFAHAGV